mmetsp:Transcript_26363/g.102846  ORF Transcript_26363/g.102846 Transcript_26363/m.102846 type:complete len:85 (-) Transcript_26363:216-470(-)
MYHKSICIVLQGGGFLRNVSSLPVARRERFHYDHTGVWRRLKCARHGLMTYGEGTTTTAGERSWNIVAESNTFDTAVVLNGELN